MGKRVFQFTTWTANPLADAATTLSNNNHMSIGAANAASGLLVQEIEIGGQSGSSAVMIMQFARNAVLTATPALVAGAASDGPMTSLGGLTSAGVLLGVVATTAPQRSANNNASKLNLTFNAFGGIVRWQAAPFEEWGIIGVGLNSSESSLSNFTGGSASLIGSHIIYEPFNT